jgi:hypothetical protein
MPGMVLGCQLGMPGMVLGGKMGMSYISMDSQVGMRFMELDFLMDLHERSQWRSHVLANRWNCFNE